jgi:hypothetical protein
MGWKAACILVNERETGYLGTLPQHDAPAARNLIEQLGLGPYRSLGLTDFDSGVYPERGRLVIGAYDGAAIVAERDLVYGTVTGQTGLILARLLELFPAAEVLVLELHSVVNYFAYASYRQGRLQRAFAGSAEDGVMVEMGAVQPEERDYFARSVVRDGVRSFELDGATWTVDQVGESLAFAMASRFLGEPLDEFACEDLIVEEFDESAS